MSALKQRPALTRCPSEVRSRVSQDHLPSVSHAESDSFMAKILREHT